MEKRSALTSKKIEEILGSGYGIEEVLKDFIEFDNPEFLVSVMERYEKEKVLEYLPQIVNIFFYTNENPEFSKVFYRIIDFGHAAALDLFWTFWSFSENKPDLNQSVLLGLEKRIVDGSGSNNKSLYAIKDIEESEFIRKRNRLEYFEYQKDFVNSLKQISIDLIGQVEYTQVFLTSFLMQLENSIVEKRLTHSTSHCKYTKQLYRGLILPIFNENYTQQIVRILPEESIPLRTRAKVPYLLVVETLDLNELEIFGSPKKLPGLNLTQDPFFEFFTESWQHKSARVQQTSPFGQYSSWALRGFLIKANDDLRQERLAMQVISKCHQIFAANDLRIYLRPYTIMPIDSNSGLIEYIPNSISLHSLKSTYSNFTLAEAFLALWPYNFSQAQENFARSMAGYSLISYILSLKDRHNGNILVDNEGHLIHIDFGFFLNSSPGNMGFESAPFKLTDEMIDLMGGLEGEMFKLFKGLLCEGFLKIREKLDEICGFVEIMANGSGFQCFGDGDKVVFELRERFFPGLEGGDLLVKVGEIIEGSARNWRTNVYDLYQNKVNGIFR